MKRNAAFQEDISPSFPHTIFKNILKFEREVSKEDKYYEDNIKLYLVQNDHTLRFFFFS